MFGLATAVHCTIQSYYPITDDSAAKEDWDSLARMYNCSINPRVFVDDGSIENIHIFRCASMPHSYLVDCKVPTKKNHFVALCRPIKNLDPGEHYFVPKLPKFSQSAKTAHSKASSYSARMSKCTDPAPPKSPKQQKMAMSCSWHEKKAVKS